MNNFLSRTAVMLAVVAVAGRPSSAAAQYFGRQKVQYDHFHWRELQTPHFRIAYYPSEEVAARDAARMAERWYERESALFDYSFDSRPLIFYADAPDFQQTNVVSGLISEGTGGVTESLRTRVTLPFTGVYRDNDHVIGHELVHVFQYGIAGEAADSGAENRLDQLPLWLVEGMAEYLSLGRRDPLTAMWMRDAALRGTLPDIRQLTRDTRYFPYRYGQALLAYVGGRWGDSAVTGLYRAAARVGVDSALTEVLGEGPEQLSHDWLTAIRAQYLPLMEGRQGSAGEPVVASEEEGAMNFSPSISPDGRYVAYFGRHGAFTIDLILADARTGKTLQRLSSPTRDTHYDALSFIATTGTWSPDGRQFAFVVYEGGGNRIRIVDVPSGHVARTIRVPGVGALQDPAWSPDGQRMAFSGMHGGISDLYVMDLGNGDVTRLTDDRYADLQPAWSPDGRSLAFVTDRATTDLELLRYGPMQLALLDLATNTVQDVCVFPGGKHIDPHYSPDGSSLYFVSDQDGFSDIYRLDLASRDVHRVTDLATGVSGITALSPAISVAATDGRILFSGFERGGNNIYGMDAAEARAAEHPVTAAVASAAGVLPPVDSSRTGQVERYLDDPATGLLPANTDDITTRPYRPGLGLEAIGPLSVGAGTGPFGFGVAGSASAQFGDLLGNRELSVALYAEGTLKDVGGQVFYQNLGHRLNWGAGIGRIPYLTGYTSVSGAQLTDGTPVTQVDQVLERIYANQALVSTRYPLSTTRRFELSGGFSRYTFSREIDRVWVDQIGDVVGATRVDTTAPGSVDFGHVSLAYVLDNSYLGFTSPVLGGRSRFEVSPTFGSLTFYTLLADMRRYVMLGPSLTLAGRVLHYGRYGPDASGISDTGARVLTPLYLGDPQLVRGYEWSSFNGSECHPTSGSTDCPVIDRLIGTRLAVANLELRVPLVGTEQFGLLHGGFLPTEIAPFVDAGLAWSAGDDVTLGFRRNTEARVPVVSAGLTSRVNLLGYLVIEAYYAYPFQRPDKGWTFGLQLSPGW